MRRVFIIFLIYFNEVLSIAHQNLRHYETLHASQLTHHVIKRGATPSSHPYNTIKEVRFNALGRHFRLVLHPHKAVIHSNFRAYSVDADGKETVVHVDHDNFYTGRVFGETTSDVKVHLEDGVMTASIHLPEDSYHIEPSWRHFAHLDNQSMIAYKGSDIKFSWEQKGQDGIAPRTCGYVKEGEKLETDDDDDENPESAFEQSEKDKYKEGTEDGPEPELMPLKSRSKRQIDQYEYTPTKTRCPLLLVADYRFFQEMGASNTKTTINYLISLIDRVHKIYNDTIWQDRTEQDGFKGMGFVIKKIVVHSEPSRVRGGEAHYNMIREKWDVRNLLEIFSRHTDNQHFCLAHLFTHQTFANGKSSVLGLAYIASPRMNSHGGICSNRHGSVVFYMNKHDFLSILHLLALRILIVTSEQDNIGDVILNKRIREYSHKDFCLAHLFTDLKFEGGILGLAYVGSPRRNSVGGICTPEYFKNGYTLYLNSGLSSSRNHYGQRVITREADLVTAHEFGHNWGSEHDPDIPECSPSASQGGSYLMYTYSVSGYDVNNKRFSPCSLRSIRKVLQAKSGRCFSEPEESFCGNLRVEGDEECDAGLLGTEDNDACCDKNCKLRRAQGAVCSDKNSPCCLGCTYVAAGAVCREAAYAACEREARCSGAAAACPRPPPVADGAACAERGRCRRGRCVPYCETQGMQSCMCDVVADACKRCCRMSMNETCFPVDQQDILPDGTPCIQGFCNKGLCEKTIQDVVERFWDIIEDININKVLLFLRDNIVGAVILVTAIIWIPVSCVISYFDRRKMREDDKYDDWMNKDDLIHPSDQRRKIVIRVPKQRVHVQSTQSSM